MDINDNTELEKSSSPDLVPVIQVLALLPIKGVDGRDTPGQDEKRRASRLSPAMTTEWLWRAALG
jgi:hypothetical protein